MIIRLSSFANESLCHYKQLQREIHTVCGVTLPSNVTVFNAVELLNLCDFTMVQSKKNLQLYPNKETVKFQLQTKRHV